MEEENAKIMEIRFVNLVHALTVSAMQQLGKFVNPLTGKTEVHLEGARATIDMLEMLREKTKGNLNGEEEKLLRSAIANLQLNYIDLSNKPDTQTAAADQGEQAPQQPPKKEGS